MPESAQDRPTTSHEYVFLMSKSERYFYDGLAIAEPVTGGAHHRGGGVNGKAEASSPGARQNASWSAAVTDLVSTRNSRSVWTIPTEAFPEAHFATFPTELARRCILAGTSEHGCCSSCGAPFTRIVERAAGPQAVPAGWAASRSPDVLKGRHPNGKHAATDPQERQRRIIDRIAKAREAGADHDNPFPGKTTKGWAPGCSCGAPLVSATVLDPFGGACTVGLVAQRLARDAVLVELSPIYAEMGRKRVASDSPMFGSVTIA